MSNEKQPRMYNLNVNVATTLQVNFLGLDGQCNTPRTPEIVNSLMAMTNPFDALAKSGRDNSPGSDESCSGTGSPLGSPTNSPPSVQHTCSQLIKEGLKLTIQTKRKLSGSDTKEDIEEFESKRSKKDELTAEDEERRKRRRERNKIAATKCRMKKREKTANLVNESEILETQNTDLKTQIQDLEKERRKLMEVLSMHGPNCVKNTSQNNIPHQQFDEYATNNETFLNGFENQPNFNENPGGEFEIGSTNGTALSPFSKDPNLAKLLDVSASQQNYSRSFDRGYIPNLYGPSVPTNYYNPKINKSSENRVCYDFRSDEERYKKNNNNNNSNNNNGKTYRGAKKINEHDNTDVFRTSFQCNDDADSYRPNGMIDGNFFTNRTDNIFGNNDYSNNFGNNPLDNGCLA